MRPINLLPFTLVLPLLQPLSSTVGGFLRLHGPPLTLHAFLPHHHLLFSTFSSQMVKTAGPKQVTSSNTKKNVHKRTKRFNRFGSDMFMRVKVSG